MAERLSGRMRTSRRLRVGATDRRRRRLPGARRRRRRTPGGTAGARRTLRHFRQATILAIAITAFLLLLFPGQDAAEGAQQPDTTAIPDTVSLIEQIPVEELQAEPDTAVETDVQADTLLAAARDEATATVRSLWYGLLSNLPKILVALVVLLLAGAAVRILRPLLRRLLGQWEKASASTAMIGILIWLIAIGIAVSVLAGDIRALVGSLGLVGLALSWALQTPIESFTGWLLNSFQGYYRVGDRIAVGEVFGDVFKIDFLTTTVWEIGSLERPGFVQAEQPTGRLITFPNNEVLAGSIINLTRDFPYVWDELSVGVGNRSDLEYSAELLRKVAAATLQEQMQNPAAEYERILARAGLNVPVSAAPQVFISLEESYTNLTVRYLVGARERRTWKSALAAAVSTEFNKQEHADKTLAAYPRQQIQIIGEDDRPTGGSWKLEPPR